MDLRRETLIDRELMRGRQTSVICTFGSRPMLSPRTLDDCWHAATRSRSALTRTRRMALIARVAGHARTRLGLTALEIEA